MSQTTTPSGTQLLNILQTMANTASLARWRDRTTEDSLTLLAADEYERVAVAAVSHLIARNAELVELRAALVAEVLTADAKADALAAENDKLREVTDDMVKKALKASRTGWYQDNFTQLRAALTAALARTPAKGNDDG